MKRKLGIALFVLFAVALLVFSVSNFVPPAHASGWVIYGTMTICIPPEPQNEWLHLYGDWYCKYQESNCSVVHE